MALEKRIYDVFGVPLRSGSLYPGTENDAKAYRDAELIERLRAAGVNATDQGDVPIPSFLPHHSIPPIRNWPGPRIAWDCVSERISPSLRSGHVPLLIGCDCSVVVGTTQALLRAGGNDVHVLYVDGDFDDAPPEAGKCQSAAALAVWLLAHESPFWSGPVLQPSQVTVLGATTRAQAGDRKANSVMLDQIRQTGARESAVRVLQAIPSTASILLHFDVDVLRMADMPAAYFPHTEGLGLQECQELLTVIARDPRIRVIEVSEYASLRDFDRRHIATLIRLLAATLA